MSLVFLVPPALMILGLASAILIRKTKDVPSRKQRIAIGAIMLLSAVAGGICWLIMISDPAQYPTGYMLAYLVAISVVTIGFLREADKLSSS